MAPPSEIATTMEKLSQNDLPWGSAFTDKMLQITWTQSTGWATPEILPHAPLQLPPSASIFHYGMAVFEGLKVYRTPQAPPRLFRPDLHLARLNKSAARLALPTIDPGLLLAALTEFVKELEEWVPTTPGASLYLRPAIIATDPRIGVRRSESATLFVIASPVAAFFAKGATGALQKGVDLLADATYVRAWKGGVGNCKTGGNYASSIAPTERALEKGFDQILWLSDADRRLVTEVGMMNVFFVFMEKGEKCVVTPRLDGTILDGVTRRSVLEIARESAVRVEERDLSVDEVFERFDKEELVEVFGTGTAAVVCPVRSIYWKGRTVVMKERQEEGDLSVLFRERIVKIQSSGKRHRWMVPVMEEDRIGEENDDISVQIQ